MLKAGIKNRKTMIVGENDTAVKMDSGTLPVFATPAMIALMEATASESIAPFLSEEITSVGTKISVSHISADPVGMKIVCESTLIEIDDRKLIFDIIVKDTVGVIGKGNHERFLVKTDRFMKKTFDKINWR